MTGRYDGWRAVMTDMWRVVIFCLFSLFLDIIKKLYVKLYIIVVIHYSRQLVMTETSLFVTALCTGMSVVKLFRETRCTNKKNNDRKSSTNHPLD